MMIILIYHFIKNLNINSGLFVTFKNNEDFYLGFKLKENYIFDNCYINEKNEFYNPIISININELYLTNLNEIINSKFIDSNNIYKIHKVESIERKFEIEFYSIYL